MKRRILPDKSPRRAAHQRHGARLINRVCAEPASGWRRGLLGLLLGAMLGSTPVCAADPIQSIHVWTATGQAEVKNDARSIPYDVSVRVFDVTLIKRGEALVNDFARSQVTPDLRGEALVAAYTSAASDFMQSDGYEEAIGMIKAGGMAIQGAIYFGIQKVPAVVINERYVIYGVDSLDEAMRLFKRKQP